MAELRDVQARARRAADGDGQHLRPQPRAVAGAAGDARHVLVQPVARQFAFAFGVEARELRDQALERPFRRDRLAAARGGEADFFVAGAVEQRAAGTHRCIRGRGATSAR